jgi:cysteine desulfurase
MSRRSRRSWVAGGEEDVEAVLVIDVTGRMCPLPVIELAKHIGEVPIGAIVEVLCDDPAAATDIPAWCRMREQDYVGADNRGEVTAYQVRRRH